MMNSNANNITGFIRNNSLLILILIFSVILFCYRISDCHVTMDEFFSLSLAQRSLPEIWSLKSHLNTFYLNTFPPLYETMLHFLWGISNVDLFWVRFLSAVFNAAAIIMVFLISKLLFDKKTAFIAASLASFNTAYIFFSKMIRCYSLLNFLGLASFYIFFKIVKSKIVDNKDLALLLFINTAMLYTHYFGGFVILLELVLSCFFLARRTLVKVWFGLLSTFVLFLPWIGHFLEDLSHEPAFNFKIMPARVFLDVLFVRLQEGLFYNAGLLIFYCAVCIYFILYSIYSFFKKDNKALFVISLLIILLPTILIINYLTSQASLNGNFPFYTLNDPGRARYLFPFFFPIFILTGLLISKLPRHIGRLLFLVIFSCSIYCVGTYFGLPSRKFWPGGLASVVKEAGEFRIPNTDKVIIDIESSSFVPNFVYSFYGPRYFWDANFHRRDRDREIYLKQLNAVLRPNYKVVFNVPWKKSFHPFDSVAHLDDFDWLFLIYSKWHESYWEKPYRDIYEEKLVQKGMQDKIVLLKKESDGDFTLEIYKIKKR